MKRLVLLLALVVVVVGLSGVSDSKASIVDTSVPDNEVTASVNETDRVVLQLQHSP